MPRHNPTARLARVAGGLAALVALLASAAPAQAQQYGDLTFPDDEHAQLTSWDYWWGAGEIETKSGNRYIVGMAFTSLEQLSVSAGYQIWPMQGPYKGKSIMTMDGPVEWGHPAQPAGPDGLRLDDEHARRG